MKINIISNTNEVFTVLNYSDCSLLIEFSDISQNVPLPYSSSIIILFLKFRNIFKKRKHKIKEHFMFLDSFSQESLIDICNFIGQSYLTNYLLDIYYDILYHQVIPKCFITI